MAIQTFPVTEDCRPLLTGLAIIHTLTLLVFGLRFVSRWLTKLRLGADDILTIVAVLSSTAAFALFTIGTNTHHPLIIITHNSPQGCSLDMGIPFSDKNIMPMVFLISR